jgi:hypothetical protein
MNRTKLAFAIVLALLVALTAAGVATAAVTTDSRELRTAVTTKAIMKHENELQAIADANDGRASLARPAMRPPSGT